MSPVGAVSPAMSPAVTSSLPPVVAPSAPAGMSPLLLQVAGAAQNMMAYSPGMLAALQTSATASAPAATTTKPPVAAEATATSEV